MASLPDDKIQEVRDRVDIVDLVGRYVELRRAGQNFKGLCPFHTERTPSFNVNPARRAFKCFGCGEGGDGIAFVMGVEGKSFPEAVRKLAEIYGVRLPQPSGRRDEAKSEERDEAYAMMDLAARLYRDILTGQPEGEAGRAYQAARGLDDEVCDAFRLGYAPAPTEAGWDRLARTLAERKHSLELAERLGLVGKSDRTGAPFDRFRGRLMFPVIAPGGEVVAFSGRIVPPHDEADTDRPPPKYYNSPEGPLYHKGKTLFGLHAARPAIRTQKRAILVEGNVDVVMLHQRGYPETVAPLGTALTPDQAHLLSRFTEQVVMCFDGDTAGKQAAWKSLPHLLSCDLDARIVVLPDGSDPDSTPPERLAALLEDAGSALEVMMTRIAARASSGAIDHRAQALDRVIPLIRAVRRETARSMYAERAAQLFGVPLRRVTASLEENSRDQNPRFRSTSDPSVSVSAPVRPAPPLPMAQARLTMLLVDVPHLASAADRTGALTCIDDDRLRPIADAVVAGAKQGEDPTMHDLLQLVPEGAQQQVHDVVFSGAYRDLADADPAAELQVQMAQCHAEQLENQITQAKAQQRAAHAEGDRERERELAQLVLALRRDKDRLRGPDPMSP